MDEVVGVVVVVAVVQTITFQEEVASETNPDHKTMEVITTKVETNLGPKAMGVEASLEVTTTEVGTVAAVLLVILIKVESMPWKVRWDEWPSQAAEVDVVVEPALK